MQNAELKREFLHLQLSVNTLDLIHAWVFKQVKSATPSTQTSLISFTLTVTFRNGVSQFPEQNMTINTWQSL